MNPINIAISVPSWSLQWDNVAIFFNIITFPVCHSAQNPLQRKVVVVIFVNKVESFKSTPCTALNQNVFLLWNMDFYLSFWNKKAWAINSFGSVPSIRFIGVSRKEGVELLARQLNIFDAVLSRSIIVQEQTWNIIWMCFPWKLLARQTFLGEILCRHLNSIWVDETRYVCVYSKVLFPQIKVKELQNSSLLFKQKTEEDFHLLSHPFPNEKYFFPGAKNLWCRRRGDIGWRA